MSKPGGESLLVSAREVRGSAREIFLQALADCSIESALARHVQGERGVLRIGDDLYDLAGVSRLCVIAVGKAAHPMAESLLREIGPGATGIVVSSEQPAAQLFGLRYYQGGHPVPNAESLRAANAILRSLSSHSSRSLVIYLISGGASAMVEKPLDPTLTLEDLAQTHRALVHSGAAIREMNAIRKHLSAVKGGRMAVAAAPARQVSILVSDVPDGALDSLGSGPTMPDSTTVEQCYEIAKRYRLLKQFPPAVRALFESRTLEETPKEAHFAFEYSRYWTILSNEKLRSAAVAKAALNGFAIEVDNSCDDWDYARAADYLLQRVRELRKGVSRVCLISGGEVTVKVEGKPGTGGRNQQFALYCANRIAGESITVLSAGSDGIDGNSPAAGGIVDGTTVARAQARGLDLNAALQNFDAHAALNALGDTITTGPTGNNLRDLRILLAY